MALTPAAYLLGTFPSADLVAKASGVDIYRSGSGNPGASNVTRELGWRKGVVVFTLDALKGVVGALVGLWLGGRAGGYVLGTAAVLGHVFPVTRRFRGGKGVASGAGMMLVLYPVVVLLTTVLWVLIARVWRKAALASILAVVAIPVGVALSGAPAWEVLVTVALGLVVVGRHAGNIRRMFERREPSLGSAGTGQRP